MWVELRAYQKDIVDRVMQTNGHTLVQLPTGGGKTLIAKEITTRLVNHQGKKVLFVAPKIVLMEQTAGVFKYMKPQIIHGSQTFDREHDVFVSTLQTASRRNLGLDVIIVDEIHYGYDGTMLEKLKKKNPNARIIGLSATPYDKKGNPIEGFETVVDDYDVLWMVRNRFLVPVDAYRLTRIDLSGVRVIAGDYDQKQLGEVVCNNKLIMEIVESSKPYIEKAKKTIVFAVDIAHCELLKKAYLEAGFGCEAVHSKLPKEEQDKHLECFKNGYNNLRVLVSVLQLTTGFDVPDTDCAVIARPTRSQNLYRQMVGRILRTAEGKSRAVLLDCGNVIENLGDPLSPIEPTDGEDYDNSLKCPSCKSCDVKIVKKDGMLFRRCFECGFEKAITRGRYTCSGCKNKHTHESKFIITDNKLMLQCECGANTVISDYSGYEEFVLAYTSDASMTPSELPVDLVNAINDLVQHFDGKLTKEADECFGEIMEIVEPFEGEDSLSDSRLDTGSKARLHSAIGKLSAKEATSVFREIFSFIMSYPEGVAFAVLRVLILHGADINSFDEDNTTLLMRCVVDSDEDGINMLVGLGADVYAEKDNVNATNLAIYLKNHNALDSLIMNGVSIANYPSKSSPISFCLDNAPDFLPFLMKWVSSDEFDAILDNEQFEIIAQLIIQHENSFLDKYKISHLLEEVSGEGKTLLTIAIESNNFLALKHLVIDDENRFDIYAKNGLIKYINNNKPALLPLFVRLLKYESVEDIELKKIAAIYSEEIRLEIESELRAVEASSLLEGFRNEVLTLKNQSQNEKVRKVKLKTVRVGQSDAFKSFLQNHYGGCCQVCGRTRLDDLGRQVFQIHDWLTKPLLRKDHPDFSSLGATVALCDDCFIGFTSEGFRSPFVENIRGETLEAVARISFDDFLDYTKKASSNIAPPDGLGEVVSTLYPLPVELNGDRANIFYTDNHLLHLLALLKLKSKD